MSPYSPPSLVPPSYEPGNTFAGTNKVEFYSAAATTWSANEVPPKACTKLVSGVDISGGDIPISTFTDATTGLPSTYDC